jgi:hypothetical protein
MINSLGLRIKNNSPRFRDKKLKESRKKLPQRDLKSKIKNKELR